MPIEPYLFFNGRCDEAIDFYRQVFGAELLMRMSFKENPDPPPPGELPPGLDDKVMHASLRIGDATVMMSDGMGTGGCEFRGFSLSHALPDETAARAVFERLCDGGQVTMPMGRTFWSPCFGMVSDRFGVGWMISVAP